MSEPETEPAEPTEPAVPEGVDPETGEITDDETDQPDDEGESKDDEQQAPPIAQAYRSPEAIEAAQASWDREKARHMRELEKRDDVRFNDTIECPLCDAHGRIWPVLPEPENTSRREFIAAVLGAAPEADYKPHPTEAICESCDGWGQVYTGSKVANQDLLNCPSCQGSGHRAFSAPVQPSYPAAPAQPFSGNPDDGLPFSSVPPVEQYRIGNDAWGRPPGHPNYAVPRPSQNAGQPVGVS